MLPFVLAIDDTKTRATLTFVGETQNITLSLPRALLKRVKRLAADRDTSVSAMMAEALGRLADEDHRYTAARKRWTAASRSGRSLGTCGERMWTRDELHER
jgi:predicted transcriptional regulator